MVSCPHCEAPIRPTATFCLACDTPVTDTERGLSVAEPVPVAPRSGPLLVVAAVAGILVALGGTAYGVAHFMNARHTKAETAAASDLRHAVTLLVRAESGEAGACHRVTAYLAGGGRRQECLDIVDKDPGVHLENVRLDPAQLGSLTGTLRLRATVVDDRGTRDLDHVYNLVDEAKQWRLRWDGKPPV